MLRVLDYVTAICYQGMDRQLCKSIIEGLHRAVVPFDDDDGSGLHLFSWLQVIENWIGSSATKRLSASLY